MNRTLTFLLIAGAVALPAVAKRGSWQTQEGTRETSQSSSGVFATTPAARTPAPTTFRTAPSTPSVSSVFAPATPSRTTTPSVSYQERAATPTRTPSTSSWTDTSRRADSSRSTSPSVSYQERATTPATTPSTSSWTDTSRRADSSRTTTPSVSNQERVPSTSRTPSTSLWTDTSRRVDTPRAGTSRETTPSTRETTPTVSERWAEQPRTRTTRDGQVTTQEPAQPSRTETVRPQIAPVLRTAREPQETVRQPLNARREGTTPREQPYQVQITPPTRTSSRNAGQVSSPFVFNDRTARQPTSEQRISSSRHDQPKYELRTHRTPEPQRSTHHHPENHCYVSPRYPTYHHQHYRPVTCYSGHDAFWAAFGFTLAAPLIAPLYVASVVAPYPCYPTRTVTTTWGNDHVSFAVSTRSTYPVYSYRPYYCTSSWYYHDGWQHSHVYYGGWRSSWYGGFSYTFNPYPVYRTYYLYEEPQTVVIQQPAQQVVIYNQPAQPAVVQNQDFVAAPVPSSPAAQSPATVAREEGTAAAEQTERCLCACKCNGKVACICEYACGSEFAYSPEAYTLGDFVSYSESLNTELIWSSYAGLDRPEATEYVAEASE